MPNVSFYVLESNNIKDFYKTIVKLTIKAYAAENQVLIYSNHPQILQPIDDYLWSFSETSFIPHILVNSNDEVDDIDHIILANFEPNTPKKDLLIQLADHVPENFNQYNRIIEILYSEPSYLARGRERFKFYRQQGIEPKTIKL
ncbi:DNA polymerase III subunit chi [Wohlfahrtiimonas larvae]|uniref:DNA polymerase III subunit chi n=1 Tax=Wohlfahrtiimonas larvae TaxID=1157986 RepID=A0ABP9MHS0_9GAMM|nr:DNA polymerase III subunit chi [Wohlfahrtiimonas larvae]